MLQVGLLTLLYRSSSSQIKGVTQGIGRVLLGEIHRQQQRGDGRGRGVHNLTVAAGIITSTMSTTTSSSTAITTTATIIIIPSSTTTSATSSTTDHHRHLRHLLDNHHRSHRHSNP
jgi:hypothetical protein